MTGDGWVPLEGAVGDTMFEQGLTPQLLPTLRFDGEVEYEA